jgi:hypothetical protein
MQAKSRAEKEQGPASSVSGWMLGRAYLNTDDSMLAVMGCQRK